VWDATLGALRTQFSAHHSEIYSVEFSSISTSNWAVSMR